MKLKTIGADDPDDGLVGVEWYSTHGKLGVSHDKAPLEPTVRVNNQKTVNIPGVLPNTVYTLMAHTIRAIIGAVDASFDSKLALFALCRKFYLVEREYEQNKRVFVDDEATVTLDCGRLYAEGNMFMKPTHEPAPPLLIRMPPVLAVWHTEKSWIAKTSRGMYAWGENWMGHLGVGRTCRVVRRPERVAASGNQGAGCDHVKLQHTVQDQG